MAENMSVVEGSGERTGGLTKSMIGPEARGSRQEDDNTN